LLIASFINTLPEAGSKPAKILFINRGVMLTTEGSRVLDSLQKMEQAGVQIFSCGTCLNHYHLKEKLKVGKVTNMYDTVDSLLAAEKVIRI
jgi:selenium metabolism protein YedF